jgi:NTE family protein
MNLRDIPLFNHLGDAALTDLQGRLRLRRYHLGDVVMRQGGIGDSMYIVRSGQLQVISEGQNGEEQAFVANLGPGQPVGELAILLGERRTATVRAVIDAELWELSKADLYDLFAEYPSIGISISRELAIRLRRTHEAPPKKTIKLIGVMGRGVVRLAEQLHKLTGTRIFVLDLGGLRPEQPSAPTSITVRSIDLKTVPKLLVTGLGRLLQKYDRILMAIPRQETALTRKATEQAEVIVELGLRSTLWVRRFARDDTYWHYPSDESSIGRVARRIAGKRIGLALSSGNARSIAHIGVLQILEQSGIPIDMLIGTSGGGLFGGLYAIGKPLDEVTKFAKGLASLYTVRSITALNLMPRTGFVRGSRIQKILDQAFGDVTFEQAKIPFAVVAADAITGEEIILDSGPMAEAVRATLSIVPLFEPPYINGRWLIDGAAVNPVPVSVLRDKVDIIIASSVIVSLEKRLERKEMLETGRAPNLVGLFFSKDAIMEAGLIQNRLGQVDALIEPDVTPFGGFDFHRAKELIAVGVKAAEPVIPSLKSVLELGPHGSFR